MDTIAITGGSGLVGSALATALVNKGYRVIIFTRKIPATTLPGISYALWDINTGQIDTDALQACHYLVHLAGAGVVDKKWTAAYKAEIVNSRVNSSALLIETLQRIPNQLKGLVSASAIGFYGADKPGTPDIGSFFKEDAIADNNFLGETCRLWEESIRPVTAIGKRLVIFRIGIVLSAKGGALAEFMKPIRMGVAAILGNGRQMISWVHIDDLCRMFIYAIENEKLEGTYNAVAPAPVTNATLTRTLARKIKGSLFIAMHVPAFVVRLMMGQRSIEVLKSASVSAEKIRGAGFEFLYPTIDSALEQIVQKQ